ncbi:hypothetical protein C8R44DRAFT_360724 [Mycena epipterygia]|nr:hypothetical protein C8R44DRAFT_360724 [Mycena epipterygia]
MAAVVDDSAGLPNGDPKAARLERRRTQARERIARRRAEIKTQSYEVQADYSARSRSYQATYRAKNRAFLKDRERTRRQQKHDERRDQILSKPAEEYPDTRKLRGSVQSETRSQILSRPNSAGEREHDVIPPPPPPPMQIIFWETREYQEPQKLSGMVQPERRTQTLSRCNVAEHDVTPPPSLSTLISWEAREYSDARRLKSSIQLGVSGKSSATPGHAAHPPRHVSPVDLFQSPYSYPPPPLLPQFSSQALENHEVRRLKGSTPPSDSRRVLVMSPRRATKERVSLNDILSPGSLLALSPIPPMSERECVS